jgi:hypothetical protein
VNRLKFQERKENYQNDSELSASAKVFESGVGVAHCEMVEIKVMFYRVTLGTLLISLCEKRNQANP